MAKYKLRESCMALTEKGIKALANGASMDEASVYRCKNGGTERHTDGAKRYAVCGQHADMIVRGKTVIFCANITAEEIANSINAMRLPGLDTNVQKAREALQEPSEIEVEIFYVSSLVKGAKVLVHHKLTTTMPRWSKGLAIVVAKRNMPNIEGLITGIMIRSGSNKAAWNRKVNGWVEVNIANKSITLVYKKEN